LRSSQSTGCGRSSPLTSFLQPPGFLRRSSAHPGVGAPEPAESGTGGPYSCIQKNRATRSVQIRWQKSQVGENAHREAAENRADPLTPGLMWRLVRA
jgi:hypothetical protein